MRTWTRADSNANPNTITHTTIDADFHEWLVSSKANEIICSNTSQVQNWINTVSGWIKSECGSDEHDRLVSCVESLSGTTEAKQAIDRAILQDINIDIVSRHHAYHGYQDNPTPPTNPPPPLPSFTPTPAPAGVCDQQKSKGWNVVTLGDQAKRLTDDCITQATPFYKARLVDTDGCHRGTDPWDLQKPKGRDFDSNCRRWAFIGYLFGAGFNTKEALHCLGYEHTGVYEVDCTPFPGSPPEDPCTFEDGEEVELQSGQPWSNADDFWWEVPASLPTPEPPCRNNVVFDDPLAGHLESIFSGPEIFPTPIPECGTPIPVNYILSAGYGKDNHYSADDAQVWLKLGKVWGYELLLDNPVRIAKTENTIPQVSESEPWPQDPNLSSDLNFYSSPSESERYFKAHFPGTHSPENEVGDYRFYLRGSRTTTWPFLRIHDFDDSLPQGMFAPATSTNIIEMMTTNPFSLIQFKPPITDRIKRIWGIEVHQNTERADLNPRIIDAGFHYSTINNSGIGGTAQITMTVYDPQGDPEAEPYTSIREINVRAAGESQWHPLISSLVVNLDMIEYFEEDQGFSLGFLFDFEVPNVSYSACWAGLELQVVGTGGSSDIWPYFQIREGDLGQTYAITPSGTNPIQTKLQQITSIKGYDDQPVILELEAGDYYTSSSFPINLPENYRLIGESPESTFIHVDGATNGAFLNPGLNSRIENCTIQCGSKISHCGVIFKNCFFDVNPIGSENVIAIDVEGRHNGSVLNCLFLDCHQVAHAGYDAVLNMTDCTINEVNTGVVLESNALGFISNCIFSNDPSQAIIDISDTSELEISYCCFANTGHLNVNDDAVSNEADSFVDDPEFIDVTNGDYRLKQPNIKYSFDETSPCIDTGRPMLFECGSSTSPDESIDRDRFDIGYHYPAGDFEYVVPKYRASASGSNAWTSELAVQNPNEYELHVTLDYYNASGTQAGSSVDIAIDPHATYRHVLTSSNAPVTTGSIELKADGPLFGHCLQTYTHTTQGVRSFMTQIQRANTGSGDVSSTSLCTGNWTAHWGGGNNVGSTEFIVKNYHDEPVVITVGKFYDPNGNALFPVQLSNYTLDAHKMYSVTKSSGFALTWGSFRIESDKPLVGEMVINSSNTNSAHYFSESVIMVPSTLFGTDLIAPMVKCSNAGAREYEDYIIVKNVNDSSVSLDITFTNADGTAPSPQPFPSPVAVPVNGLYGIDVWSAFPSRYFEGSVRIESNGMIIGHNEVVGFKPNMQFTQGEMSIAGAELDSRYSDAGRFYVPACRAYYSTSESETSQIVLRNLDTVSTSVTINAFDIDGNYVSAKSVTTSIAVGATYSYSLSSTSGESIYSIEIDSDGPISGWSERQWQISTGTKDYYDANLVQYWK